MNSKCYVCWVGKSDLEAVAVFADRGKFLGPFSEGAVPPYLTGPACPLLPALSTRCTAHCLHPEYHRQSKSAACPLPASEDMDMLLLFALHKVLTTW
jgi:hypothetical protein